MNKMESCELAVHRIRMSGKAANKTRDCTNSYKSPNFLGRSRKNLDPDVFSISISS